MEVDTVVKGIAVLCGLAVGMAFLRALLGANHDFAGTERVTPKREWFRETQD